MIIHDDSRDFPGGDSKVVHFHPQDRETSVGELVCGDGKSYLASVHAFDDIGCTMVCVEIADGIEGRGRIEEAALAVARQAIENDSWEPVHVDLRDGQTVFGRTLTADRGSTAIDFALIEAKAFLYAYGNDLMDILGIGCKDDADEDDELLDMLGLL